MKNDLDSCSTEELISVLITCDGRGPKNKQKALDILKQRWQDEVGQWKGRCTGCGSWEIGDKPCPKCGGHIVQGDND